MYGKLIHGVHWLIEISVLPHGTILILKKVVKCVKSIIKLWKAKENGQRK